MLALFVHWFLRSSLRHWQLRTAPIQMPWPPKRRVAFQMTTSLPWQPQASRRTWRVKVEFGCQIENCTISRLEVSKLPKNLYLKGLRTSWTEAKPETGKHANGICIYIYIYVCTNYVYIVTGTTERKQWLRRKRLYQYMHTACKCHTCCFSKSRIALIFYCTLPGFRKKFFIGVFYTNVVNQLSVQFL